jgi:hypothetical protein
VRNEESDADTLPEDSGRNDVDTDAEMADERHNSPVPPS